MEIPDGGTDGGGGGGSGGRNFFGKVEGAGNLNEPAESLETLFLHEVDLDFRETAEISAKSGSTGLPELPKGGGI